uniref:RFVG5814 n=1 Tax=Homo sapiens TaxID=9606 RepID=Q6UXX8_HUMAN|nr:RFVG5814 [Homo sapiens]
MRFVGSTVPLSAAGCADGPGSPASRPLPLPSLPFSLFLSCLSAHPPQPHRRGVASLVALLSCPLCVPLSSLGLQKGRGGGWGASGEEGKSVGYELAGDARLRARRELRANPGPRSVPPRCLGVARAGVASPSAQRRRGGACAVQDPRGPRGSQGAAGPVSLCLQSLGPVRSAPRAPGEDNRCLLPHPGSSGGSPHARWRHCAYRQR